jgi:hypothetical protein
VRLTVIDGYNLLFRSRAVRPSDSLQESREEFLRRVDAARPPDCSVTVVFDGPASAGTCRRRADGFSVLYARSPRSADDAIVSLVRRRPKGQVVVLTHDRELGRRVRRAGGVLGDPEAFFERPRRRAAPPARAPAPEKPPLPRGEEIDRWEEFFRTRGRPEEDEAPG